MLLEKKGLKGIGGNVQLLRGKRKTLLFITTAVLTNS